MSDEDVDRLVNLFTARLLYCMHLALSVFVRSEKFRALPTSSPDFGDSEDLRVSELQKFVDGLEKKRIERLLKEDYLLSIRNSSVELLEKSLLDLPWLKSGGHSLKLAGTDLSGFQAQKIANDQVYPALSFDALLLILFSF